MPSINQDAVVLRRGINGRRRVREDSQARADFGDGVGVSEGQHPTSLRPDWPRGESSRPFCGQGARSRQVACRLRCPRWANGSDILELVPDLPEEFSKREALMHALATEFGQRAVLSREWLSRVDFGWGPERLIDTSKGIWNPQTYAATLTIVSDPDSEYDDGDHGDSLYRYSYEKRPAGQDPTRGSNTKLREAMQLGLPM